MPRRLDRRRLLSRALGGGAGLLVLPSARTAFSYQANERLRLAVIGHLYNAGHFTTAAHSYPEVELAALCDPVGSRLTQTLQAWQQRGRGDGDAPADARVAAYYQKLAAAPPPTFSDPRKLLDTLGDRLDGLVVSVFDHAHGAVCGPALRAGKHVFSERPLGLTVSDARALRQLAARHRAATSIRNPGNAAHPFRRGVELVREGVIGPVREVHVWFFRGGPDHRRPPADEMPVPPDLNWDAWLGPMAYRPYHPSWMAYAHWREFSNGGLGTFGPHAANLAFLALRVQDIWGHQPATAASPTVRVQARVSRVNPVSFPRWEVVQWEVPARGAMPPVTFTWHHGPADDFAPGSRELIVERMREHGATQERAESLLRDAGALLVGTEGALATDSHNVVFTLLPEEKFRDVQQERPEQVPPSRGHYRDWLLACRGGEPPLASFDYAGPLSEFLMLGNVATQVDAPFTYDPAAGRIVDHPEANEKLERTYRAGWSL